MATLSAATQILQGSMFTQCSNCRTLFRITEEQLIAVDGKVRCGFCYSTFNAYDALYEDIPDATSDTDTADESTEELENETSLASAETIHESPSASAPAPAPARTPTPPPLSVAPARSTPARTPPEPLIVPTPPPAIPIEPIPAPKPVAPPPAAPSVPKRAATRATPPPLRPEPVITPQRTKVAPPPLQAKKSATPALRQPARQEPQIESGSAAPPDLFDAINVVGRELQHFKRAELDHLRHPRADALVPASTGLGWAMAALLMIILLAGQIMYQMRGDLVRSAALRPWIVTMCEWTGCTIPLQRMPQLIKAISQDLRTHPTNPQALQVRARFINEAPLAQRYPLLELELTDINSQTLGKRQFTPDQYLVNKTADISAGLAPRQQFDIELDIVDTNRKAVGYNFKFH